MSKNDRMTALAIAAVTSLVAGAATAQVHPETPTYEHEKCYGVAKAGMNDCGWAKNSCGKTTTTDSDPDAWIYVPKGTCLKLTGGSLAAATKK